MESIKEKRLKELNDLFVNKKIKSIYVDGECVELEMEDGTKLEYSASDGGYSSYEITNKNGLFESE